MFDPNIILNKLDRNFGRHGVPNVTLFLILFQGVFYVAQLMQPEILQGAFLIPDLVLKGQVWRLITFLGIPPITNPIFAFFFWYLFYLMGSSLESLWGAFRYNVFLLIGYLATIAVSFLTPDVPASNAFLQGSVFLAFAFLNPDFQLYIFFILPIKIKWLALLTWIGYFYILIFGSWSSRFLVIASICNFLFFFGVEIVQQIRSGRRQMAFQAQHATTQKPKDEPFHTCVACGITDRTHPDMDFRYCTKCSGTPCYCKDHLAAHEHIETPALQQS